MKIVFLCRLFYPHIGGVEKHVMEISKRLIKNGHEVVVITEKLDSNFPSVPFRTSRGNDNVNSLNEKISVKINGIKVYRIAVGNNDWFKKIRIWKELWRLRKVIQEADIVHCHDVFFWYLPFRFVYLNKPVFTTFHGYESYPIKKKAILMRKISEKLSWGNICIGDFIKKWYGTNPTVVSYGGTELQEIEDVKLKLKDTYSALFIGRLDEQTGVLTYTKATEHLQKKYPKFNLTIIGDGKFKKAIKNKFRVLGFQKDPEKNFALYHFAFVSRYLSILEAFASRRLVFAVYDNPVKEDYLKMAPFAKWIVIVKNEKEIAEKINYFLQQPQEEKRLTQQAFAWVKLQTWTKLTNDYLVLWNRGISFTPPLWVKRSHF